MVWTKMGRCTRCARWILHQVGPIYMSWWTIEDELYLMDLLVRESKTTAWIDSFNCISSRQIKRVNKSWVFFVIYKRTFCNVNRVWSLFRRNSEILFHPIHIRRLCKILCHLLHPLKNEKCKKNILHNWRMWDWMTTYLPISKKQLYKLIS